MKPQALDLSLLNPGESMFVPALRIYALLADAVFQTEMYKIPVSYRVTIVDGLHGVLFTRMTGGKCGLFNEDTKSASSE